jgi:glucan phosphorylase
MTAVRGSVVHNGVVYEYCEESFGVNRGISVWREGRPGDKNTYRFGRNPHNEDSKWYNKHQAQFYYDAAKEIARYVDNGAYPQDGDSIMVHGHTYRLEPYQY